MNLWTLARRLGFSRKLTVQLCWEAIRRDMAALQRSIRTASIPEHFALQKQVGHRAMLAAGLHTACRAWKQYRRKGISEQVFWDTMGCFSRFMEETRVRFGEYRFDRGWWTWRQLELRLFRLGQLEYELCGTGDDLRVAMHIPSDADLSPEAVEASLAQARAFVAQFYPRWANTPFTCHSWLLSPALLPYLKPASHIRAFQSRFRIESTDTDEACLQWLFAAKPDATLETLPEDTSLRRAVKAHLLSGGAIGQSRGTLEF